MTDRDSVFIGHANPEDNLFTLWLHAKLTNEGYKVITDLTNLTGGEEDYWDDLQVMLSKHSCKYLLVFSQHTFKKSGVRDEWEFVRSIAAKEGLKDFVQLLKVDDVSFDDRIGTNRMNQFRFDLSWANGLKRLLYKLEQDGVPRNASKLSIDSWIKNRFTTFSGVDKREELFFSNLLDVVEFPQKIYFHHYRNAKQSTAILNEFGDFPVVQHDTYLVTFVKTPPTYSAEHNLEIAAEGTITVDTSKVFEEFEDDGFPSYHDLRRLFVRLIKTSVEGFFELRGLKSYELSGKKRCFFYEKEALEKDKVKFRYKNKVKRKSLVGKFKDAYWHYGVSLHPLLSPQFCLSLKAHIVFSDDGKNVWASKSKLHSARRSKGRSFFNKDWRDFMLAFVASLSSENLVIRVSENSNLVFPNSTIEYVCDHGYQEPKDNGRLVPLDYYEELEEWMEEIEGV